MAALEFRNNQQHSNAGICGDCSGCASIGFDDIRSRRRGARICSNHQQLKQRLNARKRRCDCRGY